MAGNFTEYAFTNRVKELQERYGSRRNYERMSQSGDRYILTEMEQMMAETRDGFYLSTVNADGWPYIQFRGGPRGFLKVLDETTLAFGDFAGNRQFISAGNISEGDNSGKAVLFLMDYPSRTRLKIWAEASLEFAEDNPELADQLSIPGYPSKVERIFRFDVQAYDWNCPKHIPQRYTLEEIAGSATAQDQLHQLLS